MTQNEKIKVLNQKLAHAEKMIADLKREKTGIEEIQKIVDATLISVAKAFGKKVTGDNDVVIGYNVEMGAPKIDDLKDYKISVQKNEDGTLTVGAILKTDEEKGGESQQYKKR